MGVLGAENSNPTLPWSGKLPWENWESIVVLIIVGTREFGIRSPQFTKSSENLEILEILINKPTIIMNNDLHMKIVS